MEGIDTHLLPIYNTSNIHYTNYEARKVIMTQERASRNHLPEVLTEDEARALVAQTNPGSITGLRNRVALVLMLRAGLRVS